MEKSVEVLFSEEVLQHFLTAFQLESNVKKLGDFENYVFETYRNGQPFILRITHCSHRSEDQIRAELDWMNFLYENKVNCPEVFPSSAGQFTENSEAADGSFFFACLFSKAAGVPVKINSPQFNEELFFDWGKAIGQMHALTKHYQPKEGIGPRPAWHEEELLDVEAYFPEEEDIVRNTKDLLLELEALPKNKGNFGLIHSDIHSGNFFYDGKSVNVFDFDDSSYHWFASDIAIPIYYSLFYGFQSASEEEKAEFAHNFLSHFMKGYKEANTPPENWQVQLPLFLKLRDITLFSVLNKKIAPEDRDERLNLLLRDLKRRIIQKEAII